MFTRLQETYRIISYREPIEGPHGPDVHFVCQEPQRFSKIRLGVTRLVQAMVMVCVASKLATLCTFAFERLMQGHQSLTVTSVAGGFGALLVFAFHWLRQQLEGAIQKRIRLEEMLAPYFGKQLENTIRTLKGMSSAT